MGRGNTAPKGIFSGKPRGSRTLKAAGDATANGRGGVSPGGVADHGTCAEDDPVTWEAPDGPRDFAGRRTTRTASVRRAGRIRAHVRPVHKSVRLVVGRWRGEPKPRTRPQGSRRAAYERGRRVTGQSPGAGRAKAARVVDELREGNMTQASTWIGMSPELPKVAARVLHGRAAPASRRHGRAGWWKSPCPDPRGPRSGNRPGLLDHFTTPTPFCPKRRWREMNCTRCKAMGQGGWLARPRSSNRERRYILIFNRF